MAETVGDEISRLQREISQRQERIHILVCGDPGQSFHLPAAEPVMTWAEARRRFPHCFRDMPPRPESP